MRILRNFEYIIPSILSLILLLIAMSPLYYQYKITPPQNVFLGLHNNVLDFPMFISAIRQGQAGHLTQIQSLTSEPQMGTWVHFIYIIAGLITGPFKIHPVIVYHLLRFLIGFFLLLTFYRFIKLIIEGYKERLMVFFLCIFAGGFPKLVLTNQQLSIDNIPFLSFYTGFDVLRRSVFLPHALLKDALFLLVIIFWVLFWEKRITKYLFLSIICGFFLGFLSPIHTIFLYITMWLVLPLIYMLKIVIIPLKQYTKLVFYYTLLTLPSFLYLFWVFSIPPWNVVKIWEQDKYYGISFIEYAMGTGPLFFLAIPALIVMVGKFLLNEAPASLRSGYLLPVLRRERNPSEAPPSGAKGDKGKHFSLRYYFLIIIPLVTTPLLFLNVQKITGLTNLRFLGIPLQVFWAILAGLTLVHLAKFVRRIVGQRRENTYHVILSVCTLSIFLLTIPTLIMSWKSQLKEFDPKYFNLYPPREFYAGLLWLSKNTKAQDLVLADLSFSSLTPAYAGNTVYMGHPVSTINYDAKRQQVVNFYKTTMTVNEATIFLKAQNIKYVVWSIDEWTYGGNAQKYISILKLRFNTSLVYIFEVI